MITISVNQIKEKIAKEKGIDQEEVSQKIKSKLEELSGLISEEGAAHIVANELGVDLMKTEGVTKIQNLLPGMKNVEVAGRVVRKYEVRTFQRKTGDEGKVSRFLLGDDTGITMIVAWDDQVSLLDSLKEQDTVQINNSNVRDNNGKKEVHLTSSSEIKQVELDLPQRSTTVEKKKIVDLTKEDYNVELLVTVVQVFDPKFFQTKNGEGAVLNMFIDDGTDNMRAVFWKDQLLELLGIEEKELQKYKEDLSGFEEVKTDLLGKMLKVTGRVSENEMFNRLELVVNKVEEADPNQEIKELKTKEESPSKKESQIDDELDEEVLSLEELDL